MSLLRFFSMANVLLTLLRKIKCLPKILNLQYMDGSVMVSASIMYDQRTELMITGGIFTSQCNDQILHPVVVPFSQHVGRNFEY